jgi:phospholipid/cholesterol/gamma-HCH transport system permease protein
VAQTRTLIGDIRWLGGTGLLTVHRIGRFGIFLLNTLLHVFLPPIKVERIVGRLNFVGFQSFLVILLTGGFTGMVLSMQGYYALNRFGSDAFLGPMVALSLLRELGPVLAGLMVTGRAGSAIAAEIGVMRINEQIDALELMGLNAFRYLVAPAFIACVIALPLLTAFFNVVGIFGGYLVGVKLLGVSSGTYFGEMINYVEMSDIAAGTYKAFSFGAIIGGVCCYKGYYVGFGAEGVSKATTEAVVLSSVLILIWDYFMTSILF